MLPDGRVGYKLLHTSQQLVSFPLHSDVFPCRVRTEEMQVIVVGDLPQVCANGQCGWVGS